MYSVYIRNYLNEQGNLVNQETLMCELPAEYPDFEILEDPKVKNEMGKAGSFEFSMDVGNPWYSSLMQMRTLFRVKYDQETIFYGRVLNIDTDMWGRRKVHCEGALAFLLDTLVQPVKEKEREKITLEKYVKNLIDSHNSMVDDDANKRFEYGEIPGYYSSSVTAEMKPTENEAKQFGSGSWTSTMNCLEDLTSKYGGYWRVRVKDYTDQIGRYGRGNIDLNNRIVVHNVDGTISTERSFSTQIDGKEVLLPTVVNGQIVTEDAAITHYDQTGEYLGKFNTVDQANDYAQRLHIRQEWFYGGKPKMAVMYLDWLLNMFSPTVNNQPIRLTENIIDISNTVDVNGIFTVLIPEGTKKGKPLYLDDVPKTIVKVKKKNKEGKEEPEKKETIGPGPSGGKWTLMEQ